MTVGISNIGFFPAGFIEVEDYICLGWLLVHVVIGRSGCVHSAGGGHLIDSFIFIRILLCQDTNPDTHGEWRFSDLGLLDSHLHHYSFYKISFAGEKHHYVYSTQSMSHPGHNIAH